jgi:hypothetical protein
MAKRTTHHISPHASVESGLDWNGRYYIAFSSGASVFIRDLKELRKFLKIPKGIPMREALDAWLAELETIDAKRRESKPKEGLSAELLATGFGPEAHLDESDPNYQTRMVT